MPARQPDPDDDEPLELSEELADDLPPEDEDEPGDDDDAPDGDDDEPGEGVEGEGDGPPVIGFADEDEPGDDDNKVIRRIRDRNRELAKEVAELRRAASAPPPQEELGPKPTLTDADYDEDKYEAALDSWKDRKARIERTQSEQAVQAETANREWQRDLESFQAKRNALGVQDFDDVIEPVKAALSLAQQAVIVKAAADPAALSYALGRSDARLAELAKIQDPIKFAAAVVRMEGGIKVTRSKRKAPAPDKPARGTARLPGTPDKQLEKLETEAERTGNRTPVIQYKQKLAKRAK